MRLRSPLCSVALSLLLAACSHTSSDASPNAESAPSAPTTAAATPAAPATPPTVTVTASEKPFEQYQAPGDEALAWVGLYYAVAGTPVDYPAIAARLDPIPARSPVHRPCRRDRDRRCGSGAQHAPPSRADTRQAAHRGQ